VVTVNDHSAREKTCCAIHNGLCGATPHPTTLTQLHYDAVLWLYSVTCKMGLSDVD